MNHESEVREVLAWLEERAKNSTSFGSHCHAYEIAARKLREALPGEVREPRTAAGSLD